LQIDGFSWYNEKYWLSFSIHKVILTCLGGPFFSGHGVDSWWACFAFQQLCHSTQKILFQRKPVMRVQIEGLVPQEQEVETSLSAESSRWAAYRCETGCMNLPHCSRQAVHCQENLNLSLTGHCHRKYGLICTSKNISVIRIFLLVNCYTFSVSITVSVIFIFQLLVSVTVNMTKLLFFKANTCFRLTFHLAVV